MRGLISLDPWRRGSQDGMSCHLYQMGLKSPSKTRVGEHLMGLGVCSCHWRWVPVGDTEEVEVAL